MPETLLLPFARGSSTSRAAAVAADARMLKDKERIFAFIHERGGYGATCDEMRLAMPDLSHQTVASRVSCMFRDDGVLLDSGQRRKTSAGREAVVWIVDPNPAYRRRCPRRPNKVDIGIALAEIRELLACSERKPSKELRALTDWLVGAVRRDEDT